MADEPSRETLPEQGGIGAFFAAMTPAQRREFDRLMDVEGWSWDRAYSHMMFEMTGVKI